MHADPSIPARRVSRMHAVARAAAGLLAALVSAGIPALVSSADKAARAGDSIPASTLTAITIIVPFSAGGPTDQVARALLPGLERALGEPIRVRNVGGSGGTSGATEAAGAKPDGRTLLLHHIGMATAPALYRRLPYDPQRDFLPIGRIVDVPMVLVARPGFGAPNPRDAIRSIRSPKSSPLVAYAGLGAASHLCGLLLANALGVDLIQIPYKGTGPALVDLLAGKVDLMCDQTSNTVAPILDGRLRGIAVTTPERLPTLPDLPTTAQVGIGGTRLAIWHALYAPKGTPAAVIETLSRALREALREPAFVATAARFDGRIANPEEATPTAMRAFLAAESARWGPIIRKTGQFAD